VAHTMTALYTRALLRSAPRPLDTRRVSVPRPTVVRATATPSRHQPPQQPSPSRARRPVGHSARPCDVQVKQPPVCASSPLCYTSTLSLATNPNPRWKQPKHGFHSLCVWAGGQQRWAGDDAGGGGDISSAGPSHAGTTPLPSRQPQRQPHFDSRRRAFEMHQLPPRSSAYTQSRGLGVAHAQAMASYASPNHFDATDILHWCIGITPAMAYVPIASSSPTAPAGSLSLGDHQTTQQLNSAHALSPAHHQLQHCAV
jgi:hypothetical protein